MHGLVVVILPPLKNLQRQIPGSTPRRDGGSRGGSAVETSGFRVVVPVGCRPGQVIRVQGPEGQEVRPWGERGDGKM